jgi:hypothetical protein
MGELESSRKKKELQLKIELLPEAKPCHSIDIDAIFQSPNANRSGLTEREVRERRVKPKR